MAVSRTLRRLLQVRELEEEQRRIALESASGELHRLQGALSAALEKGRKGRTLMVASAASGQLEDRLAGMEEIRASERFTQVLVPWIQRQEQVVAERREEFMEKRIERRQAETLIEESKAREDLENGRRAQLALDDWFSNKLYREGVRQEASSQRAAEADRPSQQKKHSMWGNFEKKPIEQGN